MPVVPEKVSLRELRSLFASLVTARVSARAGARPPTGEA